LHAGSSGSNVETRDTCQRAELWRMFNVQMITGIRANVMLLPLLDKLLLRKQVIVETIAD